MSEATKRSGIFDQALAVLIDQARKDDSIEGVLVSGSYVNGRLGPYSDLDVYVLITQMTGTTERWKAQVVRGVEVEVTQDTFDGYSEVLNEKRRVREVLHPLSVGDIMLDKRGLLAQLKERASGVIEELSAHDELDAKTKEMTARPLAFGLRKIGNAHYRGDWIGFESECGFVLHLLPRLVLTMAGRRITPAPIQSLEQEFPQFYFRWTRCLAGKDKDEKWNELKELIAEIFCAFSIGKPPEPVTELDEKA